jgi:serine/threonine-protein kinase
MPERLTVPDRDILLAFLAMQMGFVSKEELSICWQNGPTNDHKSLGDMLVDQGALDESLRALLAALVDEQVKQHDNDPSRSLAAMCSFGSVWEELQRLGMVEMETRLAALPTVAISQQAVDKPPKAAPAGAGDEGRFRIVRPYARGGVGEVFLARDQELGRYVALKQIRAPHADNPANRWRFLAEAEITGGLDHPGIVPVYGVGRQSDGRPFYAMRFIEGESLKDAVARYHARGLRHDRRRVEFGKLLTRLIDACHVMAYAHRRGVVHCDLKPANIMLGQYGQTLVVDWGLAKNYTKRAGDQSQATAARAGREPGRSDDQEDLWRGPRFGTPPYMSPEQAAGQADRMGPATDIYSLGATLYYALTGKPPLEGEDTAELLARVRAGEFSRPATVKQVPAALEAICLKAMALCPEDRYASAHALAVDLKHWLADEPVYAHRESWPARTRRWIRHHFTLVSSIAVSITAALAGLSLSLYLETDALRREGDLRQQIEILRQQAQPRQERSLVGEQALRTSQAKVESADSVPMPGLKDVEMCGGRFGGSSEEVNRDR